MRRGTRMRNFEERVRDRKFIMIEKVGYNISVKTNGDNNMPEILPRNHISYVSHFHFN